jgi:hypothetical protein
MFVTDYKYDLMWYKNIIILRTWVFGTHVYLKRKKYIFSAYDDSKYKH